MQGGEGIGIGCGGGGFWFVKGGDAIVVVEVEGDVLEDSD